MEASKLRKRMPVSALFNPKILVPAIWSAFLKLDPRSLMKNPVMFVLEVVTILTTVILLRDLVTGAQTLGFEFQIVLWLWFTVLFANLAEAIAEGRGKAQADSLRRQRTETPAKLLTGAGQKYKHVPGPSLKVGDLVLVEAGDTIPSDGEVVEGIASVNEAAITGESALVIRESGGDRSAVTGGTQVLSDWIKVRITAAQGSTFLDRMIKLIEGAERQKTPNEIALDILLVGLTIIFVFATVTIPSYVAYAGGTVSVVILVALFVTLIPTTIGRCSRPLALPGWTALFGLMCWRCLGGLSKRPAMSTRCCWIRPARSRLAIGRQPSSSRYGGGANGTWQMPLSSRRWLTKLPKGDRSSSWRKNNLAFAAVIWQSWAPTLSPSPPKAA